jgi:arsenite methyltransferase
MDFKAAVKKNYGELIKGKSSCCDSCCAAKTEIPGFGVGAPVKFAELEPGEKVLDIGSGAGGNCIKAAKIVGEKGEVRGLDMTEEMVSEAKRHAGASEFKNLSFIKGDADNMPFSDESFDVVISDCVINLIPCKEKVFNEIFRVLKSGGRAVIADVSSGREFPDELKKDEKLWCGCVSGAVPEEEYIRMFQGSGFSSAEILSKEDWKEVGGIKLYNAVFRAFKI